MIEDDGGMAQLLMSWLFMIVGVLCIGGGMYQSDGLFAIAGAILWYAVYKKIE